MALSLKAKRRKHRRQMMAEINVTPMVDVMLVLLVIFMVAAPMLTTGVDVNLPESQAPALPQETEAPLAITIAEDGSLYIQNEPVEPGALIEQLNAIMDNRESNKVYLRADGNNRYETIFELMGMLSAAGYTNLGLVGDIATENN